MCVSVSVYMRMYTVHRGVSVSIDGNYQEFKRYPFYILSVDN